MYSSKPNLDSGIVRERNGKRFFIRLWPAPIFLHEEGNGVWHDVEDTGDDFNLTALIVARDKLFKRLEPEHQVLALSIIQGQRILDGFTQPYKMQSLLRLQKRIEEREQFLSAVPAGMLSLVRRYPEKHLHLLQFFARHESAVELAETNPALAFLVATYSGWCSTSGDASGQKIEEVLHLKRSSILKRLGYPVAGENIVRLIGKINPMACRAKMITGLHRILKNGEAIKQLRHLPEINLGCLAIASDKTLLERVSDRVLHEVADDDEERSKPITASKLKSCLRLEYVGSATCLPRKFHSRSRIHNLVLESAEMLSAAEIDEFSLSLPPHPLPDTQHIRALRTSEDVYDEGWEQSNCVWGLLPRLITGKLFLYRVLAPERATLSIERSNDGFCINELEAARNEPVSSETEDAVHDWISGVNAIHQDAPCELLTTRCK